MIGSVLATSLALFVSPAEARWYWITEGDSIQMWVPDAMRVHPIVSDSSFGAALEGTSIALRYEYAMASAKQFMLGQLKYRVESTFGITRARLVGAPSCVVEPVDFMPVEVCSATVQGKLDGQLGEWGIVLGGFVEGGGTVVVPISGTATDLADDPGLLEQVRVGWSQGNTGPGCPAQRAGLSGSDERSLGRRTGGDRAGRTARRHSVTPSEVDT